MFGLNNHRDFIFEEAYCEFRLYRLESALSVVTSATPQQNTPQLQDLHAQIVRSDQVCVASIRVHCWDVNVVTVFLTYITADAIPTDLH